MKRILIISCLITYNICIANNDTLAISIKKYKPSICLYKNGDYYYMENHGDTINKFFFSGLKVGKWVEPKEKEAFITYFQGNYESGKKNGIWFEYGESKILLGKYFYANGICSKIIKYGKLVTDNRQFISETITVDPATNEVTITDFQVNGEISSRVILSRNDSVSLLDDYFYSKYKNEENLLFYKKKVLYKNGKESEIQDYKDGKVINETRKII